MKRSLWFSWIVVVVMILGVAVGRAATPTLQNFDPRYFYVTPAAASTNVLRTPWYIVSTDVTAANVLGTRLGTLDALPNFSPIPALAIRSTPDRHALFVDALASGAPGPVYFYGVLSNGVGAPFISVQTASAGTLGAFARTVEVNANAGSAGGTNSPLDNTVAGTTGLYANANASGSTNTSNLGLMGTTDGGGHWNVGVGARSRRSALNTAGNFVGIHSRLDGTLGALQNGTAGFFEIKSTSDSSNAVLAASAAIIADNRDTGLPWMLARSTSDTTRPQFYLAGTSTRVRLGATNTSALLELGADTGGGGGTIELGTAGTTRWTINSAALVPTGNLDVGTSGNPVQTVWVQGPSGVLLGDRVVSSSTGDPEGARIGPVSSLFLRSDGAKGSTLYTKVTGTGNTGWDPVPSSNAAIGILGITIDGGGGTIQTGIKGDIYVPYNCTIESVTLLADVAGAIVVDIWKDVYANYPPDVGDSITASAKPTITATSDKSTDSTLTGWGVGKTVTAGDTLRFNVDSVTTITRLTLTLKVLK